MTRKREEPNTTKDEPQSTKYSKIGDFVYRGPIALIKIVAMAIASVFVGTYAVIGVTGQRLREWRDKRSERHP